MNIENIRINEKRTDVLISKLVSLWELSVKVSHSFLTHHDIFRLRPHVQKGLKNVETLITAYYKNEIIGFIGIECKKTEMLFVSPSYFGKGIGRRLMTIGIEKFKTQYVDVNEENPNASTFYHKMGFVIYNRNAKDSQGNNFPILKMKRTDFYIRNAESKDIEVLQKIFKDTILSININDYSINEAKDWASCGNNIKRWKELITSHYFIVAETYKKQIIGFSSISRDGYINSMFVHKDFQRIGIATTLLNEMELYARTRKIKKLTSEVSITAINFFQKNRYIIVKEQKRKANKMFLTNYLVEKYL